MSKDSGDRHPNSVSVEDILWYHEIASTMIDERVCNHELVPCLRPNGVQYDHKAPLAGLEIWWRPSPDHLEHSDAMNMACFGSACKLGFDEGLVTFNRGYLAGFQGLTRLQQDEIVRSYMIAREARLSPSTTFVDHVKHLLEDTPGLSAMVKRRISVSREEHEAFIRAYIERRDKLK